MKKKILALFAVILAAIGLVGVAKVSAETVTRNYFYDLSSPSKEKNITSNEDSECVLTMNLAKASTVTDTSITGASLKNGESKTFTKGLKINSDEILTFQTKGSWTIKMVYSARSKSKINGNVGFNVNSKDSTKVSKTQVEYDTLTLSDSNLSNNIKRSSNCLEFVVYEMLITVEESNATYYNVNYYDEDKKTELCESVPVESGKTTTAPTNISFSKVGKKFKAWVDSDGKEFDFETQITTDTNLYATYEEDSSYSVTNKNAITSSLISAIYNEQITKVSGELEITNTNYALSNIEEIASANIKIGKISSSSYLKLNAESKGVLNVVANNGSTTAISKVALFASDKQTVVSTIEIAAGASDSHELIFNISETGTYYLSLTSDSTGSAIRATSIEFVPFNALTLVQDGHRTVDDNVIYSYRFVSIIDGVSSVSDLEAYTFEITYTDENGTSTTKKCSQVRIVDEIQNSDGTVYEQTIVGSDNSSTKYTFSQNATRKYVLYSIAYKDNSRNYTGTLTFTIKLGENVISTKEVSWK